MFSSHLQQMENSCVHTSSSVDRGYVTSLLWEFEWNSINQKIIEKRKEKKGYKIIVYKFLKISIIKKND